MDNDFSSFSLSKLTRRQMLHLIGVGAASLTAGSLLSGCAVDPVTGQRELVALSENDEIRLDKQQSPHQFSADYGVMRDQTLNGYITNVGLELSSRSHRLRLPYSFRGVNAAYINAYAFPGGSIAVTHGILLELENEAELAALLGHEIGHVNARHAAERAGKGMLTGLLLAGVSAAGQAAGYEDADSLLRSLGGLSAGALLAHYSRDDEREADGLGMEYMTRAGYRPEGMVGLMEILIDSGRATPGAVELMFATHPMSRERLATARQQAKTSYSGFLSGAVNRQRYMDHTERLRRSAPAIRFIQKGGTAFGRKKYREADELLGRALAAVPNDYAALVMRAKCRLAMGKNQDGLRFAKKAVKVYPDEGQGHLVFAIAEFEGSNYGSSLERLRRYEQLLPGNPEIIFFKGRCFEEMSRREEAAASYRRYLQRVRQGENARHAHTRLKAWGFIR